MQYKKRVNADECSFISVVYIIMSTNMKRITAIVQIDILGTPAYFLAKLQSIFKSGTSVL